MSRSIFDFLERTEGTPKKKLPEKENSYVRSAKFGLQESAHGLAKILKSTGGLAGFLGGPLSLGGSDKEFNERYGADEISQDPTNKFVQRTAPIAALSLIPAAIAAAGGAGAGTVLGMGASALGGAAGSGLGGQVVEELGGGPIAQAIGELGGGFATKLPGMFNKKLPSNPNAMVDLKRPPIQPNTNYDVKPSSFSPPPRPLIIDSDKVNKGKRNLQEVLGDIKSTSNILEKEKKELSDILGEVSTKSNNKDISEMIAKSNNKPTSNKELSDILNSASNESEIVKKNKREIQEVLGIVKPKSNKVKSKPKDLSDILKTQDEAKVLEDTLESITTGKPHSGGPQDITPLSKTSGSSQVSRDKFIEEARALGLSEEEITPLIQSEGKQKWLAKAADKGSKTQERLDSSKKAIENIYENITHDPRASKVLSKNAQNAVFKELNNVVNNIPTSAVVEAEKHIKRFINSSRTGKDLMLLHKDLNNLMNTKEGMKSLSLLKDPIRNALGSIHPELGNNFRAANDFMSKWYDIASSLNPTETSKFLSAAKSIGIGKGVIDVITGNGVSGLKNIVGTIVAKSGVEKLSRAMLTNPRFQDLGRKMVLAIKQNKPQAAQAIIKSFAKTAIGEGIDPEIVALIQSGF